MEIKVLNFCCVLYSFDARLLAIHHFVTVDAKQCARRIDRCDASVASCAVTEASCYLSAETGTAAVKWCRWLGSSGSSLLLGF